MTAAVYQEKAFRFEYGTVFGSGMVVHHGCIGTVSGNGSKGFSKGMFLLQTVMAHHGVHITLGHGFFSCHTSFQIDGKTNHCNTVLDMGKLQIFDLCLALDTLQINDRLLPSLTVMQGFSSIAGKERS